MKPWHDTLQLPRPLRSAQPLAPARFAMDEDGLRDRERQAYERGRQEGERALSEQLVRQRAELIELQHGVLAAMRNALPDMIHNGEADLAQLALTAAERLVAGLPISPELVAAVVREALAQAEAGVACEVLLHPEDLALLQRITAPWPPGNGPDGVRFRAAAEISRGGCLVKTRFGVVDAQREAKLAELRKSLLT